MARFGCSLNQGKWNGSSMHRPIYFNQMIIFQPLNESYGYLWWLNGKLHMQPRIQFTFNGTLNSNAPQT